MNPLAQLRNPFGHAIISDAWDPAGIDVPEINARAFDTCLEAFERVSSGRGSESIVLHGQAGSGKTHLLGRLQSHFVREGPKTAPDGALRCIFIAVKLQTSPQMLWQHLRRRVADDILRVTEGASQLQRLVAHYLAAADPHQNARAWVRNIRVLSHIEDEHVESLLDEVAERARLGFELRRVLSHLIYRRNVAEARGWLRGDPLPEDALRRLGLSPGAEHDPEESARELILSLCRLAGDSLPMVLCFDQVEALQAHTQDASAFFRLGRLLADVFESDDNILLITCLQSAVLDLFRRSVRDADWDRLSRRGATLDPLDRPLAGMLLQRRLDAIPELAELRRAHPEEPLWPLPDARISPLFPSSAKVPARRVLMHAEALFQELQTSRPAPPPPPKEQFLADELERRFGAVLPRYTPSDTDENLRHGLPLLVGALERGWRQREQRERDVHLVFEHEEHPPLELAILNQENMTSLAASLKRLVEHPARGRRVILRDPRLPVSKGAKRTREHLAKLTESGVRLVEPDVEVLALLETIRGLLSDARSGDLTHEGLPLAVGAVEAWLREALDPKLEALVEELFVAAPSGADGPGAEPTSDPRAVDRLQDLAAFVTQRLVAPLEDAARALERAPEELEQLARAHPTRFGLLAGPPVVLFAYVPPAAESAPSEEVPS